MLSAIFKLKLEGIMCPTPIRRSNVLSTSMYAKLKVVSVARRSIKWHSLFFFFFFVVNDTPSITEDYLPCARKICTQNG